jgi:hypothetical protein
VIVYNFEACDIVTDKIVIPERMATIDFIKRIGRVPLMDTATEVDFSDVDDNGRYPIRLM